MALAGSNQAAGWSPVSAAKLGSWFLLMIVSYVLVTLVSRPEPCPEAAPARPADPGADYDTLREALLAAKGALGDPSKQPWIITEEGEILSPNSRSSGRQDVRELRFPSHALPVRTGPVRERIAATTDVAGPVCTKF
jgi:hypothetical protein